MTHRVVFLDFDGVLNSRAWLQGANGRSAYESVDDIDPVAVGRVQRIVDATDARIVISSTWRLLHEPDELRAILQAKGLTAQVVGVTPSLPTKVRGDEIQKWLDRASVFPRKPAGICILDDDTDMVQLTPWLVRTYFEHGLTDYHVSQAIEMLSRPGPPVLVGSVQRNP